MMARGHFASHISSHGDLSVEVTTIDREFAGLPRLDLIKLDVEGAECDVIQGGMKTIARLRPRMVIEVHSHMKGRENNGSILTRHLNELGYDFRRIWENTSAYYYIEATPRERPFA